SVLSSEVRTLQIYIGTSGYSYKEWKGPFYPATLPATEMLAYYADHFTSVEINNTFYKNPTDELLAGWTSRVPKNFRFTVKANQRITHTKRLKEPETTLPFFLDRLASLGTRAGPVLFQLPPNFKPDLERLESFLKFLFSYRVSGRKIKAAFEFRHQ